MDRARWLIWVLKFSLVFFICSCAPETVFQGVLGIDAEAPVFLSCQALGRSRVEFLFSEEVNCISLRFDPALASTLVCEGHSVIADLEGSLAEGGRYLADILVEDKKGNSLSVLCPFRGRNDRMPQLCITELRTEYSKPKVEFIEFKTESAGQLGGLRLFVSENGFEVALLEFPCVEVESGEYIVVHLRKLDENSVDELGALDESPGIEALASARDFWIDGNEKHARKTDAIAFIDQDGKILDALLISESPMGEWKTEEMASAANALAEGSAWNMAGGLPPSNAEYLSPLDALFSVGTTTTRTICRDETIGDSNKASDWYVTATSCATPGAPNRTERYIQASPPVQTNKVK